jgi:hypothetical protein
LSKRPFIRIGNERYSFGLDDLVTCLRLSRQYVHFDVRNQQFCFDQLLIQTRFHQPDVFLLILTVDLPVEDTVPRKEKSARVTE